MQTAGSRALTLCAAWLLAACSQLATPPGSEDLMQGLRAFGSNPILDSSVERCQPGEVNGEAVQVCDFCVVSVAIDHSNSFSRGQRLAVGRAYGSAAFRRAISYDQPTIAPSGGARGVWVMLHDTVRSRGETTSRPLTQDLMSRAGFEPQSGWNAFYAQSANRGASEAVGRRFADDAALRQDTLALVGACAAPAQGQQETSGSRAAVPRTAGASSPPGTVASPTDESNAGSVSLAARQAAERRATLSRAERSVVRVVILLESNDERVLYGSGSGFVVAPNLVVTNARLVSPARDAPGYSVSILSPQILTPQGYDFLPARVVRYEPAKELALIEFTGTGALPRLTMYPNAPHVGDRVTALGYPDVDLGTL